MVRVCDEDLKVISSQLGRTPKNVLEVSYKCSYGFPVVVKSNPVLDEKPFPTIYWLTCPYLRYRISQIEAEGGIVKYEKIINSSKALFHLQEKAHLLARKEAIELAGDNEWIIKRIKKGGMGGISDFSHLKCLHLQVAYHLGGIRNPVGKMVLDEIRQLECKNALCEKYKEVM